MDAEINKLQRRIEALTKPYLSTETEWLVGSNGRSDEIALESLAKCGQRITVVGYHAFDISPAALKLLEQYGIPFVDATTEQLPKEIERPSDRDLIFLTRADLTILFWNGHSEGIGELIAWYTKQGKDHVIGFV